MNKFDLLLEQMTSLKILSEKDKEELKPRAKELEWEIEIFPESLILIPVILAKASKAILEDAERAMVPPDYDKLIASILKLIDFDHKEVVFDLNYQKNEGGKDFYKISLSIDGTPFEKELLDVGDYYDVSGVQKLISKILSHYQADFELISIETGDQAFCLAKGKRDRLINLYRLYHSEYFIEN